ncbi:unnamed protein product [Musa acuminata var. zebrina]
MSEQKLTDEQRFKEDKMMRMLFGQGMDRMDRDGFDGSKQEHHIFMEVFSVTSVDTASNHNIALNTMDLQKDEGSQSKLVESSNCESSVLTSSFSTKDSSGEASQPACVYARQVSGSRCFADISSCCGVADPYDADIKCMKVSSIEQQNHKSIMQSYSLSVTGDDLLDLDRSQNSSSMLMQRQQQSPCLVIETCSHDILSSCYLSKTNKEIDGSDDMDDGNALDIECKSQDIRDDKIIIEAKSVTSPVSQESFASGLLVVNAAAAPAETPGVPIHMKHIVEESSILNSGSTDVASKRALIRELPERLRLHTNRLLTDAGWKIEPRVRSDRTKLASYYIAPKEKLVVTSLSQAWKACGRRLYSSAMDSELEDNGREWTNIDRFWSDLTDTLFYVEENTQSTKISISLLKRWQLLDPFVAVVCINRKVGVLREGKSLKAVSSATFILSEDGNTILAGESKDRVIKLATLDSNSVSYLNYNVLPASQLDHEFGVTEVSRNQQRIHNCHDLQNSSRPKQQKRKFSCSAGTQGKNVKSLAACSGNGLHGTKCSHHVSCEDSSSPNYAVNGADTSFAVKDSFSNPIDGLLAQDSLAPVLETLPTDALAPFLKTSPTDDSNACKSASTDKSLFLQESNVPSSSNAEHLVGNGPCDCKPNRKGFKEARQQRTVISAKRRVYGKHLTKSVRCDRLDLLSHENTANIIVVVDERLATQPSDLIPGCEDGLLASNIHSDIITEKVAIKASESKDQNFSVNQVSDSGKKVHKKSKKISEIRASKVDGTNDEKSMEALNFRFDDRSNDYTETQCNQEDSQTLAFESTLGCMKENTCATVEDCSNVKKKMVKSESKAPRQHLKGRKGKFAMSLENKEASKSIPAVIDEEHMPFLKRNSCNAKGLSSQVLPPPNLPSLLNKAHKCTVFDDSVVAPDDGNTSTGGKTINAEVLCSDNPTEENKKLSKPKVPEACKKRKWKRPRGFRINDDDLLIAAIIKNKDYISCNDKKGPKLGVSRPKILKKHESQKGGCKLLLRTPGKGGLSKDGKGINLGARTVLCWLIDRGVLSLKDVLQYRNPKNNALVKDGWITRNGILCKCCMEIFSVSAFKAHSGSKFQKPSSNLFLQSGRSYTLCQLQAWSADYKARKGRKRDMRVEEVDQNDDTCGLCIDGGELICCDNCPSTYHQTCLTIQVVLPEGSWYCHNCICKSCGDVVDATTSSSFAVLECSQCEHKYHGTCVKKRNLGSGEVESGTWFCGKKCKEVYLGLRSHVGILNCLADGFSWTILRCNHDDQKINSTQKIALMAECNTKLAIALSIMEECFLPMVDPRTHIDMIPHVLYNRGSNFTRLNYQGFYTVVLEKSDEVISVASIRIHGVTVAEMPLIATCSEYRRQGMCRRLIDAIEKMLKSFGVKMLVISAIPILVETWTSHFGFKPIEDVERRQLNHVNLMLFPGTALLIKQLEEPATEESGSKSDVCLKGYQSVNPDGSNEVTNITTEVQADRTARTDSEDEALLPTADVTYQMEQEHDWQQKDLLVSSYDTLNSIAKPNDNDANISEPFRRKIANLDIDKKSQFDSAEHTEQEIFTSLSVVSKSTALHSCSGSRIICATDDRYFAESVPINDGESEKVDMISEAEAKNILEEDNRLFSEGDGIEQDITNHSSEAKCSSFDG